MPTPKTSLYSTRFADFLNLTILWTRTALGWCGVLFVLLALDSNSSLPANVHCARSDMAFRSQLNTNLFLDLFPPYAVSMSL